MIVAVIVLYGVALLFDRMDRPVFELTGARVSGHTLKHVVAAMAAMLVAYYLHRRRPGHATGSPCARASDPCHDAPRSGADDLSGGR